MAVTSGSAAGEESATLEDIVAEALRIMRVAEEREVPARLLGGVAVRVRAGGELHATLQRRYEDIDLVVERKGARAVEALLAGIGYRPNEEFNMLQGRDRLLFEDPGRQRQLDVFVGSFIMCHEIDLTGRITREPVTLPAAELLLTKLQVVELNEKDLRDVVALCLHHDVGGEDAPRTINGRQVAKQCASDWGLWRTVTMNLDRVRGGLEAYLAEDAERATVLARVAALADVIDAEPKSGRWRMRARVGERKRWYELPEEKS
jgi:hypothetical protein